jgi:hypothetical protein
MCQKCNQTTVGQSRVRLVEVQGDQEEFADLIGTEGVLQLGGNHNWYNPDNLGDTLQLAVKSVHHRKESDRVSVKTKLGNTFTFRLTETK